MPTELNTPITKGGLQHIPFFNGRVLTAEDLKIEQKAHATERHRLGRAVGSGVIEGLFVRSGTEPEIVSVGQGLALAPSGRVVELPSDVDLSVVSEIERDASTGISGRFEECSARDIVVTSGTGAYLLIVEPATEPLGRTPRTRLGGDGAAGECGAQYRVAGARLRLVPLDFDSEEFTSPALADDVEQLVDELERAREGGEEPSRQTTSMLQNLWAHALLDGSATSVESVGTDLPVRSGRSDDVGTDAVPLGLVYWSVDRVEFVDPWAARTVVRPPTDTERVTGQSGRRVERLLQFVDHLHRLIATHANPREIRLDDYVRFVPAAGMVPAFDVDAPRGVDPTHFLEHYSRGITGEKRPGPLSELLHQSLMFPPVDLAAQPNLLRFRERSAPDVKPSQLFQGPTLVFVHRDVGVSSTSDGATGALETARSVYQSILHSRAFEPATLTSTQQAIARSMIRDPLRDVIERAGQRATGTAGGADVSDTLDAFQAVYDAQIRLVEQFQDSIDGIEDDAPRQRFGRDVEVRLRKQEDSNIDATLEAALDDGNLVAAIDAQSAVNDYVGRWIGDTIATGPTTLRHIASPEGDILVPPGMEGAPSTFPYTFDLENGTDQQLQFRLSAQATAPTGDWTGSATVRDADGNEVTAVTLDSATAQTLSVGVSPPEEASIGETATLVVRAIVPPPNDRTMRTEIRLPIQESAGSPTSHIIEFSNLVVFNRNTLQPYDLPSDPSTTPIEIPISDQIRIRTDASFSASTDPTSVDFDVTASLSIPSGATGDPGQWPFSLIRGTTQLDSTTDGEATGVVSLSDGETIQLKIDLNVPDEVSREAVVALRVEAPDLEISDTTGELMIETVSS